MKRFTIALLAIFLANNACTVHIPGGVQGSGNIVAQNFDVSGFDQVELRTIGEVYIELGDTESLTIETDDNILPLLDARVESGKLTLRAAGTGQNIKPSGIITYTITVKNLRAVTASSSGDISAGSITTDDFSVTVNASGDVTVESVKAAQVSIESNGSGIVVINDLDAESVQVATSASGGIELGGKVESERIETSGSGKVLAGDLNSAQSEVSIQGSGDVTLWVDDSLDIAASGSGEISYYGKPTLTLDTSGSGKIESLGKK